MTFLIVFSIIFHCGIYLINSFYKRPRLKKKIVLGFTLGRLISVVSLGWLFAGYIFGICLLIVFVVGFFIENRLVKYCENCGQTLYKYKIASNNYRCFNCNEDCYISFEGF